MMLRDERAKSTRACLFCISFTMRTKNG
jgi:hypothetical protein